MTEQRCPACEALIVELDCLECEWHLRNEKAIEVMVQRAATLQPLTSTHCPNGHLRTEENTRIDIRVDHRKGVSRACRTCHNEKAIRRRAMRKAQETTQPREPGGLDRGRAAPTGRMTPRTLPVEGTP